MTRIYTAHRLLNTGRAGLYHVSSPISPYRLDRPRYMSGNTTPRSLLTLAIESSCDDTCVALLEKSGPAARLLFNKKVTSDHRAFGGIMPVGAVESHISSIGTLVRDAMRSLPECAPAHSHATLPLHDAQTGQTTLRRLPDFISVTRGPGMLSSLSIGLTMAKGLSAAWQVPLLGVHHMQAHALTPRLITALNTPWPSSPSSSPSSKQRTPSPTFPFLTLLVSGGHTQLVLSTSLTTHAILADKSNVAVGDMLDKCGRAILPADVKASSPHVMYGAQLESFAFPPPSLSPSPPTTAKSLNNSLYNYTPPFTRAEELHPYLFEPRPPQTEGWFLTPPLSTSGRAMAFDFSGLGGRVQAIMADRPDASLKERRELARGAMKLTFEHLASRVIFALEDMRGLAGGKKKKHQKGKGRAGGKGVRTGREDADDDGGVGEVRTLVVSGGVASNRFLRRVLRDMLDVRGFKDVEIIAPPVQFCTDNAAMIGWTGLEMYEAGWQSELDILPVRSWSFDPNQQGGIMELGGWKPLMAAGEVEY